MRLFGCTRDNKLLPIDLNFEQFARSGIHPRRIDLMEPNPIELPFGEHDLKFSPLRDLAFVFRSTDGNVCVAVHNGESKYCVTGDLQVELEHLVLRDFRLLDRSFEDGLREYMEILHTCEKLPEPFLRPQPASIVNLQGNELRILLSVITGMAARLSAKAEPSVRAAISIPPRYEGVMLEEQQHQVELPPAIRVLLEEFPEHQPFVSGTSLRKAVTKQRVTSVDVQVENTASFVLAVSGRLGCSPGKDLDNPAITTFKLNDVRYKVRQRMRFQPDLSVDALYCTDPKVLCGFRIAFSDIFSKQARFLTDCNPDQRMLRARRAQIKSGLQRAGYEFLDHPAIPCKSTR